METYTAGLVLGKFAFGAAFGLFPLIVAIVKKRALIGVALMVICGLLGFVHPVAAIGVAAISGIALCFIHKNV